MDAVLKVVGTIGAIWLAVSILVAIFWGLVGKRIFRKPPAPPIEPYEINFTGDYEIDRRQLDEARRRRSER